MTNFNKNNVSPTVRRFASVSCNGFGARGALHAQLRLYASSSPVGGITYRDNQSERSGVEVFVMHFLDVANQLMQVQSQRMINRRAICPIVLLSSAVLYIGLNIRPFPLFSQCTVSGSIKLPVCSFIVHPCMAHLDSQRERADLDDPLPLIPRPQKYWNAIELALLGDAVWEYYIRRHCLFPPAGIARTRERMESLSSAENQVNYWLNSM